MLFDRLSLRCYYKHQALIFGEQLQQHMQIIPQRLLGRRQANLCFHFAGSGENLPDITKSRDASLDNKELYSFT